MGTCMVRAYFPHAEFNEYSICRCLAHIQHNHIKHLYPPLPAAYSGSPLSVKSDGHTSRNRVAVLFSVPTRQGISTVKATGKHIPGSWGCRLPWPCSLRTGRVERPSDGRRRDRLPYRMRFDDTMIARLPRKIVSFFSHLSVAP